MVATYPIDRFSRDVGKQANGGPLVHLTAEASDLEIRHTPTSFMLMGKDNALHTFSLVETERDGTVDNEIVGWRFMMKTRTDISVLIIND